MNTFFNSLKSSAVSFAKDEEGAQIIEYALIIAVVSIALIVALKALNGNSINSFIARVGNCLTTNSCT